MKTLTCTCGAVFEGNSEDSVIGQAMKHMKQEHPEMVEGKSDDEIKAMLAGMVKDQQ